MEKLTDTLRALI